MKPDAAHMTPQELERAIKRCGPVPVDTFYRWYPRLGAQDWIGISWDIPDAHLPAVYAQAMVMR